jgi:hypothetical protein
MSQFRNKSEAQQAIQELKASAAQSDAWSKEMDAGGAWRTARDHRRDAREYRAEAASIRALLPTLPD